MKKRFLPVSFILLSLFVTFIGPWPVFDQHFENTPYAASTFNDIAQRQIKIGEGRLFAGVASVDITPPVDIPLGGYGARNPNHNNGVLHPVKAKAISLKAGTRTVTILSPEILLPLPEIIDEVLVQTGLNREDVYFTSTHTHSGPGGYAHGLINEIALGEFSKSYFSQLSRALSVAVIESRQHLIPVNISYQRLAIPNPVNLQFVESKFENTQPYDTLHLLTLTNTDNGSKLASLFTLSAHPTHLGRVNMKVSGDYPGLVMQALEQHYQHPVLFSVGAVGGLLPGGKTDLTKDEFDRQFELLNTYSALLTKVLQNTLDNNDGLKWTQQHTSLSSEIFPIQLPQQSYLINERLRLSPWLVDKIFHNRLTYVHALQIGQLVMLGMPADYSGELALELEKWAENEPCSPWINSFNGDYIGYLSPSERMLEKHYSTRDVAFFGRYSGDYFAELSRNICHKLAPAPSKL